jgi:hypothetical protein
VPTSVMSDRPLDGEMVLIEDDELDLEGAESA